MFQSTRPRGARQAAPPVWWLVTRFNPRARVGRDRRERAGDDRHCVVSIHAPAWGATPVLLVGHWLSPSFNPRARVGRDICPRWTHATITRFNPRARVGRDAGRPAGKGISPEFQSTRPRGARRRHLGFHHFFPMFQSTRPRGARPQDSSTSA